MSGSRKSQKVHKWNLAGLISDCSKNKVYALFNKHYKLNMTNTGTPCVLHILNVSDAVSL